jgi:hypothetical protein
MSYTTSLDYEPAQEPDELASWLAWAIVAAFAIWAGWGWLNDGMTALSLLLAVVFGLFQVATNILAVKVRELARRGAFLTMLAAFAAMIATGLLTHESLNHAYAEAVEDGHVTADAELMSWLLLGVPFLEPLLFWINKLLTEPAHTAPAGLGLIPTLMIILFGPSAVAQPPQTPPPRTDPVVRTLPKPQARNLDEPARAQAKLLASQGMKAGDIHRATGVPLATCKRWVKAA